MMMLLWLTSAVGAALFFMAGWLAGRGRRAPLVTTVPIHDFAPPAPSLDPELALLRAELAAAQVSQVGDRTALQQVTHDLGAARAQVERLRIDLMRAQKQSTDLQGEGKTSAAELSAARNQLNKLREELVAARHVRPAPRTPLTVRAAGHKAGDVLQALVDGVSGSAD